MKTQPHLTSMINKQRTQIDNNRTVGHCSADIEKLDVKDNASRMPKSKKITNRTITRKN